jgi:S1-C subfamily serine protease
MIAQGAKLALEAAEEVAPGLAEAALSQINLLEVAGAKVAIKSESDVLVQYLRLKAPPRTPHMSPLEIMSIERSRTSVASVGAQTWLGETASKVSPHIGNLTPLAGGQGGSAVVLKDGYVLTADHCISKCTNRIMESPFAAVSPVRSNTMRMSNLTLSDGRTFRTELVAYNQQKDIALLKIHGDTGLPGLKLAEKMPETRQRAAAFGYPSSRIVDRQSVSPGTFKPKYTVDPYLPDQVPYSIRTYHGYSGGAIVGDDGVLGIVSHGGVTPDQAITSSPKLEDIRQLVHLARQQKPGSGILKVSSSEKTGKLELTHERTYDWWNQSEAASESAARTESRRVSVVPRQGRYVRGRFFAD